MTSISKIEDIRTFYDEIISGVSLGNKSGVEIEQEVTNIINSILAGTGIEITSKWLIRSKMKDDQLVTYDVLAFEISLHEEITIIDPVRVGNLSLNIELSYVPGGPIGFSALWIFGEIDVGSNVSLKICSNIKDLQFYGYLNVQGSLKLQDCLKKVGLSNFRLHGEYGLAYLNFYAGFREKSYSLSAQLIGELDLKPFTIRDIELDVRYVNTSVYGRFLGNLSIGKVKVQIEAEKNEEGLSLEGRTVSDIPLESLFNALGVSRLETDLTIKELRTKISKTTAGKTTFDFDLDIVGTLDLKIVTLTRMYIQLTHSRQTVPGESRKTEYSILGTFEIFSVPMFIEVQKQGPGFYLAGGTSREVALINIVESIGKEVNFNLAINAFPKFLRKLKIKDLSVTFNTAGEDFSLTALLSDEIAGEESDLAVDIQRNSSIWTTNIALDRLSLSGIVESFLDEGSDTSHIPNLELKNLIFIVKNGGLASLTGTISISSLDISLSAKKEEGKKEEGEGQGWLFHGSTEKDKKIEIGHLIADLAGKFNVDANLPAVLTDLTIDSLLVSLNTGTKEYQFICGLMFPVNGKASTLELKIDIKKQGKTFEKQFSGRLAIGEHIFAVSFSTDVSSRTLAASYTGDLDFTAVINEITGQSLPTGIIPEVKNLVLLSEKEGGKEEGKGKGKKAMAIAGIGFAPVFFNDIPVIGDKLGNFKLGINKANLLYSNQLIPRAETQNLFVSSGSSEAESDVRAFLGNFSGKDIKKGLNFDVEFIADGTGVQPVSVSAPVGPQTAGTEESAPSAPSPPATQPPGKSLVKFGPISIDKIGLAFKDKKFWLNADASVDIGGLLLKVIGLGLGVNVFEIKEGVITKNTFGVDLRGVQISYQKGSVEIQGSFINEQLSKIDQQIIKYKFSGSLVLEVPSFGIVLIGQYTEFKSGDIALFCYGALIAPIPLPPTPILITAIALGFGYNYSFALPSRVEEVDKCPLMQALIPGSGTLSIENLSNYISPNIGQGFVAVGISVSISKLVDATLLAVIQTSGKIQVLGKATLVIPPKAKAAAAGMIRVGVIGTIDPNEGIFIRGGLLAGSYILFSEFKLTGGFAFYIWSGGPHKGDFVFTIGGYHPKFALPDYYPRVNRLGFSLRLYDIITLKGEIYCALTSSAIMAGGALDANLQIGSSDEWFYVKISFLLEAHLIFSWSPYYYDAQVRAALSCDVGIKLIFFWVRISVSLSADLHIWGPDFAGTGYVTFENPIKDISFRVSFGAANDAPPALVWDSFKESFLQDNVLSVSVKEGLLGEVETLPSTEKKTSNDENLSVVDCNNLVINIDTEIPITSEFTVSGIDGGDAFSATNAVGIAPMDITGLTSKFTIEMTKDGAGTVMSLGSREGNNFTLKIISKDFPKALWGQGLERTPSLQSDNTTVSALGRIEIIPMPPAPPDRTHDISCSELAYIIDDVGDIAPGKFIEVEEDSADEDARRVHINQMMKNAQKVAQRKTILGEFGISDKEINEIANESAMDKYVTEELVIAPRLKKAA